MTTFLAIVLSGLGTYLSRAIFILALARRRLPGSVTLAMEYVGPAVLGALVITLLVSPDGEIALGLPEILGLITAALVAWASRSHLLTLGVAMTVFWVVRGLLTSQGWMQ